MIAPNVEQEKRVGCLTFVTRQGYRGFALDTTVVDFSKILSDDTFRLVPQDETRHESWKEDLVALFVGSLDHGHGVLGFLGSSSFR